MAGISLGDRVRLSPFEKWKKFKIFPWLFVLHLLLIVATTAEATSIVNATENHARVQQQVFSSILLGNDDGSNTVPFYSIKDFQEHLQSIFEEVEGMDQSLLQYSWTDDVRMKLGVYYQTQSEENAAQMDYDIDLEEGTILRPFNLSDPLSIKLFLAQVEYLQIELSGLITSIEQDLRPSTCLNWTISIDYSLQSYANVEAELTASESACQLETLGEESEPPTRGVGFDVPVLLLSIAALLLSWREAYEYIWRRKQEELRRVLSKEELQKISFFDLWFFLGVAGHFLQISGAVVSILVELDYDLAILDSRELLVGFGAMFAWTIILKYLQYSENLDIMSATLRKSWKNIFMFLLGVLPFFMGFVFLGQCIFWKYSKFEDTTSAIITLFSLSNGDIVNDTFLETWAEGVVGQIYLIFFMILFYTAMQNVFITIIMEGYEDSIKEKESQKAVYDREEEDRLQFEQQFESPRVPSQSLAGEEEARLEANARRIERALSQIEQMVADIKKQNLSPEQQAYLLQAYEDSLVSLSRNLKFQIHSLS